MPKGSSGLGMGKGPGGNATKRGGGTTNFKVKTDANRLGSDEPKRPKTPRRFPSKADIPPFNLGSPDPFDAGLMTTKRGGMTKPPRF